jgi:NDP-sugar pyrophosphorylase family protein
MRIDHCLILAAGLGTRMGTIGQKLPKVLWPVFEKSLLELQVAYAKSLGIQNISINLHFMGDDIFNFCKDRAIFENVNFLWEKPDILDIGGAIHNLASMVKYKGKLLVLNADQFFYLKQDDLIKILTPYSKFPAVIFTYPVNSSMGYNALEVDHKNLVKKIIKNKDLPAGQTIETYTGISLIDLAQLTKTDGPSAFFDSVCPFKEKEIAAISLSNVDYWDFGTINRYWDTSFRILKTYSLQSNHPFLRFLVQERALKTWKIDLIKGSYYAKSPSVINLGPDEETIESSPAIILKGNKISRSDEPAIYWNDLMEKVK